MSYTKEELEAMGAVDPSEEGREERNQRIKELEKRIDDLYKDLEKKQKGNSK